MSNWSQLLDDLLIKIAHHIKEIQDFVAFGMVCKTWNKAGKKEYFKGLWLWPGIPYLLLATRDPSNDVQECYSLIDSEIVASVNIPKFDKIKCYESLGWLLVVEEDGNMYLLNPFSSVEIPVPHQSTFPGYEVYNNDTLIFVKKFVLTARPCETCEFIVMIICDTTLHLAFWRPGDECWNKIERRRWSYVDVMYHDGHFYAIDCEGCVSVFTLNGDNPPESRWVTRLIVDVANNLHRHNIIFNELVHFKNLYILKTSISLFMISRAAPWTDTEDQRRRYNTRSFYVYEVDESTETWTEINNIGSMAIFVGHNTTFAVDASRFSGKIKGNHIYFSDDGWFSYHFYDGGKDMGGYNLETGTFEAFYAGEVLLSKVCPSIWITP